MRGPQRRAAATVRTCAGRMAFSSIATESASNNQQWKRNNGSHHPILRTARRGDRQGHLAICAVVLARGAGPHWRADVADQAHLFGHACLWAGADGKLSSE